MIFQIGFPSHVVIRTLVGLLRSQTTGEKQFRRLQNYPNNNGVDQHVFRRHVPWTFENISNTSYTHIYIYVYIYIYHKQNAKWTSFMLIPSINILKHLPDCK
jgi:hypothetical protein